MRGPSFVIVYGYGGKFNFPVLETLIMDFALPVHPRASKCATNEKALLKWIFFAKYYQLSLSDTSLELFLIQILFKNQ